MKPLSQNPSSEEKTEEKDSQKAISKKLAAEGFHNATRVKLVKGSNGNITKFGDTVNSIKAMHETNIDEYNSQQVNSGMFIKKDGVKYELADVKVPGRNVALKMFMEVKK